MDSVNLTPPVRRSMSDEQLAEAVNQPHVSDASIMAAMQLLESQSLLRAEDLRREAEWIQQMKLLNSAESLAALRAFQAGEIYVPPVEVQPLESQISEATPVTDVSSDAVQVDEGRSPGLSLFEQIAMKQRSADAQPVFLEESEKSFVPSETEATGESDRNLEFAELGTPSTGITLSEAADSQPQPTFFPLIPLAPAPILSVDEGLAEPDDSQEIAPEAIVLAAADEPLTFAEPLAAVENAEQRATEFEELVDGLDTTLAGSENLANPSDAHELTIEPPTVNSNQDSEFDEILGIAPRPATEYIDEPTTLVSTAHGPKTNQRAGALFFNWLPIGGSVLPVILAVYVHSLGLALTDSIVAVLLAIFAAFATTTAGAIAGKRAGLPTFVVSRATFGVFGARFMAAFFAILKLVTASVMVLLLVIASQGALGGWSIEGPTATRFDLSGASVALWQIIIGVAVALVAITSFIKLRYVKFLNFAVGIIASLGVLGSLAFQLLRAHLDIHFYYLQSWPATLGASAIVFAALGSVWSSSGADFASLLEQSTKGAKVVGWSALSLFFVPSAIAGATLVLLEVVPAKVGLLGFSSIVPKVAQPYAYAVLAAVTLLLAAIELRSARIALRGINPKFDGGFIKIALAIAFVAISLAGWHFYSSQGLLYNLKDYALVLSAPVAAWLGIFSADSLVRRIAYHEISLTRSYGFYGNYNLVNIVGLVVASSVGLGMLSSKLPEFSWVGFLAKRSINPAFWAESNLGIAAAFALGAIFVLCFGIGRIKRQEAEVIAIESRRHELRDVLVTSEIQMVNSDDSFEPAI